LTFKSTGSKKKGKNFEVNENLMLKGKTKEITVIVEPTGTGKGMQGEVLKGYHTESKIKRSDFGMNYMQGAGLGDEVKLIISTEAAAK
jgi:polyisoprenoid-binding protein YceI